ncbi:MAG: DNA-processing protein DprA [Opitutales bacterium]
MSDPELTTRQALLILNGLRRIGPISLNRLMDAFGGDPLAVLDASRTEWTRVQGVGAETADSLQAWRDFPLEREERNLRERKGSFLIQGDEEYPPLLGEIHDPPIGLYRLGELPKKPFVAIVGTRKPTLYGTGMARKLAGDLTRAGLCVVSGMARGIDTAAHEGALEAGGETVTVFGCGLDVIYPPENLDLFKSICSNGAVLSEFPFGRRADRQTFPMRNRLVSGMSEGVIVVESGSAGGSLITARFAGEQGRQVLAVPGRVDQPSSAGCHQLIRDGAVLVRSVSDVVEELAASIRFPVMEEDSFSEPLQEDVEKVFSSDEAKVMQCFSGGAILRTEEIARMSGLPATDLAASLTGLELKRALTRSPGGAFEAR